VEAFQEHNIAAGVAERVEAVENFETVDTAADFQQVSGCLLEKLHSSCRIWSHLVSVYHIMNI